MLFRSVNWSAMVMAFAFTLAFRGIVSIQRIYFGAAFFVALLFVAVCALIFRSSAEVTELCSIGAAASVYSISL